MELAGKVIRRSRVLADAEAHHYHENE